MGTSLTVTINQISYRGWPGSLVLSNGIVEAFVVPTLGRVMQFRFAGEESGAFWENRAGHAWPPPLTFDYKPFQATVTGQEVVLVSALRNQGTSPYPA
jgi:hypothetical protein